jgi:hypothetical protein
MNCVIELWGLDAEGNFLQLHSEETKKSFLSMFMKKQNKQSIADMIHHELEGLLTSYIEEQEAFKKSAAAEKEKSKRLLFLFQKDLLPGINGQILENKERRDVVTVKGVSRSAKWLGWTFLALLDGGMLFYVLLFALSQTKPRQNAWARSFGLWLVSEVIMVSTVMVWLMHILIPSMVMKEVGNIKEKLLDSVALYYQNMAKETNKGNKKTNDDVSQAEEKKPFNAAKYLFLSYRMAKLYPELKVAKIISQFSTPWPKQSYHHVVDVTKGYNRKFSAISRSVSMVALFFLTNLLSVPLGMQDMIMQMVTTTAIGYTTVFHIQLYQIYPVLVIVPALFLCGIIHFIVRSTRANDELEQKLFLQRKANQVRPEDDENQSEEDYEISQSSEGSSFLDPSLNDSSDERSRILSDEVNESKVQSIRHFNRRQSVARGIALVQRAENFLHTSPRKKEEIASTQGITQLARLVTMGSKAELEEVLHDDEYTLSHHGDTDDSSSSSSSSGSKDYTLSDEGVNAHGSRVNISHIYASSAYHNHPFVFHDQETNEDFLHMPSIYSGGSCIYEKDELKDEEEDDQYHSYEHEGGDHSDESEEENGDSESDDEDDHDGYYNNSNSNQDDESFVTIR